MALCFISVGSNIERDQNVRGALRALHAGFAPLLVSAVYETEAVGFQGAPFYNLVVAFMSEQPPQAIAAALADIEQQYGRGQDRSGSRTLDLDLLLHGDTVLKEGRLTLPRPEIERYGFVLEPMAEIAPQCRHPQSGQTYAALWSSLAARVPGRRLPLSWTIDD